MASKYDILRPSKMIDICFVCVAYFSFFFSGIARERMSETRNTPATMLEEKISPISSGNIEKNDSSIIVTPIPILNERAMIVIFRSEKPQFASIFIPLKMIEPNIITVHPPRTESGSELKNAPIGGKRDARIRINAPIRIVKRFTTFVIDTRPTFWLKEVIGLHPNRPESALQKPSQARDP